MTKLSGNNRKTLKKKMAEALSEQIKLLPAPLRDILVDDLVTAFENRLEVFHPEQPKLHFFVCEETKVPA